MANCAISGENYKCVLNTSETFKITTMKDYHDLYLNVDVLFLACVYEAFRKEFLNSFAIETVPYLSTPCYSWDTMVRFTDINLKLISDIGKEQFMIYDSIICKG